MTLSPRLVCAPSPRSIPEHVVVVRPSGSQSSNPGSRPTVVVRAACGSTRRIPFREANRIRATVNRALNENASHLWLCEREWLFDQVGSRLVRLERQLVDLAEDNTVKFVGWTERSTPRGYEVYETVEGGSPSHDPALDGGSE